MQTEDQRGVSGPTVVKPWRWQDLGAAFAGQRSIAWLKVSCSSPQRGQSPEAQEDDQEGWAAGSEGALPGNNSKLTAVSVSNGYPFW